MSFEMSISHWTKSWLQPQCQLMNGGLTQDNQSKINHQIKASRHSKQFNSTSLD